MNKIDYWAEQRLVINNYSRHIDSGMSFEKKNLFSVVEKNRFDGMMDKFSKKINENKDINGKRDRQEMFSGIIENKNQLQQEININFDKLKTKKSIEEKQENYKYSDNKKDGFFEKNTDKKLKYNFYPDHMLSIDCLVIKNKLLAEQTKNDVEKNSIEKNFINSIQSIINHFLEYERIKDKRLGEYDFLLTSDSKKIVRLSFEEIGPGRWQIILQSDIDNEKLNWLESQLRQAIKKQNLAIAVTVNVLRGW